MTQLSRALLIWSVSLACLPAGAYADTIYSLTGSSSGLICLGESCFFQIAMVGWTTEYAYDNVSIAAEIGGDGTTPMITASLTNMVGPSATAANQIASVTVTPSSIDSVTTLFSGLTLGPGDFDLVLSGPTTGASCEYWYAYSSPSIVTDSGVSAAVSGVANELDGTPNNSFAAASVFDMSSPMDLAIQVTGTQMATAPEPRMDLALAAALLLGTWLTCRRRPT